MAVGHWIPGGVAGETKIVSSTGVTRVEPDRCFQLRQGSGGLPEFVPRERELETQFRIAGCEPHGFLQFPQRLLGSSQLA